MASRPVKPEDYPIVADDWVEVPNDAVQDPATVMDLSPEDQYDVAMNNTILSSISDFLFVRKNK